MQAFLTPAVALMRGLRLLPKFLIVACLFAIPALLVSGLFVQELNKEISLTESEKLGLQNLRKIQEISYQTQEHRGLRHLALAGNASAKQATQKLGEELDLQYQALQKNLQVNDDANSAKINQEIQDGWSALKKLPDNSKARDSYIAHNALLLQLQKLATNIADDSNLNLDPQVDTYYLIGLYAKSLPELNNVLADTAARGAPYIDTGLLEPNEDVLINANVMLSQRDLPKVQAQLDAVVQANPRLQNIREQQQAAGTAHLAFLERTKSEILSTLNQTSGTDYLKAGQQTINQWRDLGLTIAGLIEIKLDQRLQNHIWNRNAILLAIAAVIFIAAYLLAGFYVAFARELRQLTSAVHRISDGNLSVTSQSQGKDEVAQLIREFESMRLVLIGLVKNIRNSTEQIASSSEEIASGNADLSTRTEQQASSLEETSASMEELTIAVKQNIQSAQQANQMAMTASDVAKDGGAAVKQMTTMMEGIAQSSKQINDIIAVIDGIAFQTNILALNAAVEAARAGEQGRGFAVVATEVRNLAQRSAAAAKEIKQLIGNSVNQVEAGNRQVQQAGSTMQQVVESIINLNANMHAITDASVEQGDGIQMVNATLSQLDHITQQNAALVEQAAAAAESMRAQASKLTDAVAAFTIEIDHHHETTGQPPSAKRLPPVKRASKQKTPAISGLGLAKQLASH
jgi:methyl-accepting chemotaxis protein